MSYRVCVFTSTRADFGMLVPLLRAIDSCDMLQLELLVSGSHLSHRHGYTLEEIVSEGFTTNTCVDIGVDSTDHSDSAQIFAAAVGLYADYFSSQPADLCIILGDRYEAFAAATAAYFKHIPIAHIAGGETTEGALDEAFRHSITKMARVHFTTTENYRRRVIQLGEAPACVFNVGGLFIDNAKQLPLLDKDTLFNQLGIPKEAVVAAITYHPETLSGRDPQQDIQSIFDALHQHPTLFYFFTYANADDCGTLINDSIDTFVAHNLQSSAVCPSLGRVNYLSLLSHADLVIGNSSSGIVEAPSFQIPSINIGDRQKGRLMADSTINCPCDTTAISTAISTARSEEFRRFCKTVENPHGDGSAAEKIVTVIKQCLEKGISKTKTFYDL